MAVLSTPGCDKMSSMLFGDLTRVCLHTVVKCDDAEANRCIIAVLTSEGEKR